MTDSSRDNSKDKEDAARGALARFFDFLSADTEEAGRIYTGLHRKLVGFFTMKGICDPSSAADETIDRAALKISAGTPVPDVNKYCLGIARNIARERLRHMQREGTTFMKFIEDLANGSGEMVERIEEILKPCFEQLAAEEQKLLEMYCQVMHGRERAEHRRQMAENMRTTVRALRIRVTRLRTGLTDCVKKHSNDS